MRPSLTTSRMVSDHAERIVEIHQRHGADLSGTMALLAVLLQDAADVLGVGDPSVRLGFGNAADVATGRLRPRLRDRLFLQDLIERDGEIAPRRFAGPRGSRCQTDRRCVPDSG